MSTFAVSWMTIGSSRKSFGFDNACPTFPRSKCQKRDARERTSTPGYQTKMNPDSFVRATQNSDLHDTVTEFLMLGRPTGAQKVCLKTANDFTWINSTNQSQLRCLNRNRFNPWDSRHTLKGICTFVDVTTRVWNDCSNLSQKKMK